MRLTLPNLLTIARLLAAPAVALCFVALPRPVADWLALALFVGAAATDWLDGALARASGTVTRLGTMLDPIADKAMVVIALAVLMALSALNWAIALPAAAILFREVFVSGLREYLGDTAGTLKVTPLAKWKTAVQMTAVAVLLANGIFGETVIRIAYGLDEATLAGVLSGQIADEVGLRRADLGAAATWYLGIGLLWLAGALTLATGWDYFKKALPYLEENRPR